MTIADEVSDDDARNCKWHVSPHPYSKDFDVFVTDDDMAALEAAQYAIEQAWDTVAEGDSATVTIRHYRKGDPL